MHAYKVHKGSLQERFLASTAKIQFYGGGFANGKTSGACIKTLLLAQKYPGANILMARSTYPKLEDTLKKEFLKWCPKEWIKSKTEKPNNVVLTNGSMINFRYVSQQGKSNESSTSNLLSANYDLIVVDQMEDPEITHKDFLDLLGRLRGMAKHIGGEPHMPQTGPRWMIITSNPTRNWVYQELIKPMHDYAKGLKNPKLLIDEDTATPIIEIFEGSTYANADNLEPDYIKTLETAYTGQMKERFLMGKWGAYEGLVYPTFDETVHVVSHDMMENYIHRLQGNGVQLGVNEGYDYGLAVPSCYMLGFVDDKGNVFYVDGFYQAEMPIEQQAHAINEIRTRWGVAQSNNIHADPSIFRRGPGTKSLVGISVAGMFAEDGVQMIAGNNDILNGITKVQQYLKVNDAHNHPFYGIFGAPRIFFSDRLHWLSTEFGAYTWKKNTDGKSIDEPIDKNDHALDTLKYSLSRTPTLGKIIIPLGQRPIGLRTWGEMDMQTSNKRMARHG